MGTKKDRNGKEGGGVDGIKDFRFHSGCITIKKKPITKGSCNLGGEIRRRKQRLQGQHFPPALHSRTKLPSRKTTLAEKPPSLTQRHDYNFFNLKKVLKILQEKESHLKNISGSMLTVITGL